MLKERERLNIVLKKLIATGPICQDEPCMEHLVLRLLKFHYLSFPFRVETIIDVDSLHGIQFIRAS